MTEAEIKKHKIAAKKLESIKDAVFGFIGKNVGKISEYDVNRFILSEFKEQGLALDKNYPEMIVAAGKNTAFVHYFPKKNKSQLINKNQLILIDIFVKLKGKNSPFADITWMGYTGKEIPLEMKEVFRKVAGARDFAVGFIKKKLKKGQLPKTNEVESAVRKYFGKIERYFLHGAGHSLGFSRCHGKYFRFGKKSRSRMKSEIPFTIEPGLYFKGKFGIRSEINCVITKDYKLEITTKIQKAITKI